MNELLPIVDFSRFLQGERKQVAKEIGEACSSYGFFGLKGHGIESAVTTEIDRLSRQFFSLALSTKMKISMDHGGLAWRGYFPVGGELTSGAPDLKEGIYFGEELDSRDERVRQKWPLHGANLYPEIEGFREQVLTHIAAQTRLGHQLMKALSISLGLDEDYIHDHLTAQPTVLYRIFHYPAEKPVAGDASAGSWGVGEHTDYGLLTILTQDDRGGLEVKTPRGWLEIPPAENVLICNVGDMLDYLTLGRYRSAPHRVKNRTGLSRLSFPFFFDPGFSALMKPLPLATKNAKAPTTRWDQSNLYDFEGTYGDYLISKVAKVFPKLAAQRLS